MSDPRLCAEIFWKIENFTHWQQSPLDTEKFVVNTLGKSSWYLEYNKTGGIYLYRANDDNVKQPIALKMEVAVLDADNEPQNVKEIPCSTYDLGHCHGAEYHIAFKTVCDNAKKYLQRNIFTIRCRMWLPENQHATHITRATLLTELTNGNRSKSKIEKLFCIEKNIENVVKSSRDILMKDVVLMYRDGILCDFSIQVKGRTFPVHTFILASRSPVFRKMLLTDMKEKNDKILKLDDLDEDTVHQMLEYMYSGDPGELSAESAIKLYYVGDQYQMSNLKKISAQCLKSNITLTNACDLFQLGYQHDDEDLKSFAIEFIRVHEKEIILSEEFKTLFASNNELCWNIFIALAKSRLE